MTTIIKNRKLEVKDLTSEEMKADMICCLKELSGVIDVDVLPENKVRIKYDLMRIRFSQITKRLHQHGFVLTQGVIQKIKQGWIGFTEQNEYDSMNAPASPCCSNPQLDKQTHRRGSKSDHISPSNS